MKKIKDNQFPICCCTQMETMGLVHTLWGHHLNWGSVSWPHDVLLWGHHLNWGSVSWLRDILYTPRWKPKVIMMPILWLVVVTEVAMTTYGATSDVKVGIMTTLSFQCREIRAQFTLYCTVLYIITVRFVHQGVMFTKPISSVPLFSDLCSIGKTQVSYWMYHNYIEQVAPVQYKCDSNNLRGTFARSKSLLNVRRN